MVSVTGKYIELFSGRTDCYGSWEGGCVRRPVTPDTFTYHLEGMTQVGIYPATPRNGGTYVKWGCTDIDVDDYEAALRIQQAFGMKGITTWIEKTRKGYHVWLFCTTWIEARTMRNAYLVVHKVTEVPPTEVNPKQAELEEGKIGNYVRLPYPNDKSGLRYIMNEDLTPMGFDYFVEEAYGTRATPREIEQLASMWKEPEPLDVLFDDVPTTAPLYKLGRNTKTVFDRGVMEGKDRSSTLFYLACCASEDGLTPSEIVSLLYDADHRWGKFSNRSDGNMRIQQIVEAAVQKVERKWAGESQTRNRLQ
jgi:hypothetical protein